jgi:hypothetical protein
MVTVGATNATNYMTPVLLKESYGAGSSFVGAVIRYTPLVLRVAIVKQQPAQINLGVATKAAPEPQNKMRSTVVNMSAIHIVTRRKN